MLEWQTNDSGEAIPYVEGKPLCSKVSPIREANLWADKVMGKVYATTEVIVVLGYGAGFHIQALKLQTPAKIFVFEMLEEISNVVKSDSQVTVIGVSRIEVLMIHARMKEIICKKFQIFQHYPSSSPFLKDYDSIRHAITARNKTAFKKQVELYNTNATLANVHFEDNNELLTCRDIATHPTVSQTSNQKIYLWKILGELLK